MKGKKIIAVLIGVLMLLSIALVGCGTSYPDNGNTDDDHITDEDVTVAGIDKADPYTWFDVNKADLPDLEACGQIRKGMSLNQVIRLIGKPQRDVGYGAVLIQFDVADGSTFTITFDKDLQKAESDPDLSDYDCLVVNRMDFDTEIPDAYFPYCGTLNGLYPWIDRLNVEEIVKVRFERAYIGVAPGNLKDVSYTTDSADIEKAYRLLFGNLREISPAKGQVSGGGYVRYDFFTANNQTYTVTVSNNIVYINDRYYKFVGKFYYAFQNSYLDCHSFITYLDRYEIYTYAQDGVKVGEYDGLGQFEFCKYDGLIEAAPSYRLTSSEVNLLILSSDKFMIEGDDNTVVYRITGEKDFSSLFENNDDAQAEENKE